MNPWNRPRTGVDIDGRWVRAAQVRPLAGAWTLDAALCMRRDNPADPFAPEEGARLAAALERAGFECDEIVLAAPHPATVSGLLDLPPKSSGAPLDQIARVELARQTRLDPCVIESAMWELPVAGRGDSSAVMAVALPHAAGDALLDAVNPFADVAAIDVRACALLRSLSAWVLRAEPVGILDLGWDAAGVIVIHRGIPVYQRITQDAGLARLYAGVERRFGLGARVADALLDAAPPAEDDPAAPLRRETAPEFAAHRSAVIEELGRSLTYIDHRYAGVQARSVVITGPGATLPSLPQQIEQDLGIQARVVTARDLARVPPGLSRFAGATGFACAIGLAIPPANSATTKEAA